jgi:hypothetical protein
MTQLHPLASIHASTYAPVGEAMTHDGASVLIGDGLRAIIAERMEQVQKHGFTLARDQNYQPSALVFAGIAYAGRAAEQMRNNDLWHDAPPSWPWDAAHWRPGDARANLVKAAALIWAEIDRLDHAPRNVATDPFVLKSEPETIIPGRACRDCGCTDERACMDGEQPCHWIAPDLCSACEPVSKAAAA